MLIKILKKRQRLTSGSQEHDQDATHLLQKPQERNSSNKNPKMRWLEEAQTFINEAEERRRESKNHKIEINKSSKT